MQEILERALSKYFGCKTVRGSGRTDAGVDTLGQSVTFVLVSPKKKIFNKQTFINSINFF